LKAVLRCFNSLVKVNEGPSFLVGVYDLLANPAAAHAAALGDKVSHGCR
jgi:hypothetical protein